MSEQNWIHLLGSAPRLESDTNSAYVSVGSRTRRTSTYGNFDNIVEPPRLFFPTLTKGKTKVRHRKTFSAGVRLSDIPSTENDLSSRNDLTTGRSRDHALCQMCF